MAKILYAAMLFFDIFVPTIRQGKKLQYKKGKKLKDFQMAFGLHGQFQGLAKLMCTGYRSVGI
jgi:hypothetical protein